MDSRSNLCGFGHHCSLYKIFGTMKLEYTEGCVVSGLDVDEERFYYMDSEEKKSYFNKCIDWYKNRALLEEDFQDFLIWLVEKYGDCQYVDHCEQCGDSIYTTTLEI